MAADAEARNKQIYLLLNELLKEARKAKSVSTAPLEKEVESLFSTPIWGHREIVLTILMARLMNPKFKASEDFYACNPRSIFEKPIREFFREHNVPHKKSGPLNVAKNIKKINEDWAANKRGDDVAMNVVRIVKVIEELPPGTLRSFAVAYVVRYVQEAERVKKLKYKPVVSADPIHLARLCCDLIVNVPDGGATPQIIVGFLIEAGNFDKDADISVSGHRDSVSTTNTTSKKAGDVVEELPSGNFIYEITVKKFDADRMRESYEAIKASPSMGEVKDVFVICRSEDIHSDATSLDSSIVRGVLVYQDIAYFFVDIFEWIREKTLFMTPLWRTKFHEELTEYVNNTNTSEKVKAFFKKWHSEQEKGN